MLSRTTGHPDLPLHYHVAVRNSCDTSTPKPFFADVETDNRPETLRMSELNDSSDLQRYSSAVLYVISAVTPPSEYVEAIADNFLRAIKSSGVRGNPDSIICSSERVLAVLANPIERPPNPYRLLLP